MPIPAARLVRTMFSGENRRSSIVLLASALCLTAWHSMGNYDFWLARLKPAESGGSAATWAATASLSSTVVLLALVPLLVVKFVLRERLSDYAVRLGNIRFASMSCLLATPLIVFIGFCTSQSPEFQRAYPTNPLARTSVENLAIHLALQVLFYAAWEFHFRGFLQHALEKSSGISLAIWVQVLASTLAHFGKPMPEVFGAILGGLLWGALAWRTRSLLAGIYQHWLLGASLDFFICRNSLR